MHQNAPEIHEMMSNVATLGPWDAAAVLGSWNYLLTSTLINRVVKFIPDAPSEASGIDEFTEYSQCLRAIQADPYIREQFDNTIKPLLGLKGLVETSINDHTDVGLRDFEDTLRFMTSRPPTREQFVAEYQQRKRMGSAPRISVREFVDAELQQALQRHHALVAKGEFACQILSNTQATDGGEIDEWVIESMHDRMVMKLQDRWQKLELRVTNPRLKQKDRDESLADQRLIEELLKTMDAKIPSLGAGEDDGLDAELALIKEAGDLDILNAKPEKQDPKAPGKMTIIRNGEIVQDGGHLK
jgi:hypothetical protein